MATRPRRSIRTQLTLLTLLAVGVSIALFLAGTLSLTLRAERGTLDRSLLNSASILAQDAAVLDALQGRGAVQALTRRLDNIISQVSDIDLILVADADGRLLYAPDRQYIGRIYSGSAQAGVLAGQAPYTSEETGYFGSEHSAYAPVRDEKGAVLGFAAVGVYTRSLWKVALKTAIRFLAIGLMVMALGVFLAQRLSGRIKRSLLGLEPDVLARQFHQLEDILEALEEGVVAIDKSGTVIFLNTAAAQMISRPRQAVLGRPIRELDRHTTLPRVLKTGKPEYNLELSLRQDLHVLLDQHPLYEDGQLAGAVGIFRNRTELIHLSGSLTDVRHMVDAMRAYTHEFMNKLHVILGLLELGKPEKARQYILDTTQLQREVISCIVNQIQDPAVAALLIGKISRANELGIRLRLDKESSLQSGNRWLSADAYVTILGNLIENAFDCLNHCTHEAKEVTVSIRETERRLFLCVEDTGPGIAEGLQATLFQRGVSSKGAGRGIGLSLVQQTVTLYHGTIRVESEPHVGTSFFITFRQEDLPAFEEELECTGQ